MHASQREQVQLVDVLFLKLNRLDVAIAIVGTVDGLVRAITATTMMMDKAFGVMLSLRQVITFK